MFTYLLNPLHPLWGIGHQPLFANLAGPGPLFLLHSRTGIWSWALCPAFFSMSGQFFIVFSCLVGSSQEIGGQCYLDPYGECVLSIATSFSWWFLWWGLVLWFSIGGSVVRAFAQWAGGRGFDPRPRHTKDVIKMVPDASLFGAQHIRTGLASLSSQTSFKTKEMNTIRNERSRVINISWDNLFCNRP